MHANATVAIVNTAIVILIGFLCWFFSTTTGDIHWWPVFLVFAFMRSESTEEVKENVGSRSDESE